MGYYTTVEDVAATVGINEFPITGPVTRAVVESWIEEVEKDVEERTGEAWRSVSVSNEYHDFISKTRIRTAGVPIYLNHMYIYDLDSSKGDKLELWDGSSYTDYVVTKTNSRASDYWLDSRLGIIYINQGVLANRPLGVRVTYRYGNNSCPASIRMACRLFVGAFVLETDPGLINLVVTGDKDPVAERIVRWRRKADAIIDKRSSFRAIGATTN